MKDMWWLWIVYAVVMAALTFTLGHRIGGDAARAECLQQQAAASEELELTIHRLAERVCDACCTKCKGGDPQ